MCIYTYCIYGDSAQRCRHLVITCFSVVVYTIFHVSKYLLSYYKITLFLDYDTMNALFLIVLKLWILEGKSYVSEDYISYSFHLRTTKGELQIIKRHTGSNVSENCYSEWSSASEGTLIRSECSSVCRPTPGPRVLRAVRCWVPVNLHFGEPSECMSPYAAGWCVLLQWILWIRIL